MNDCWPGRQCRQRATGVLSTILALILAVGLAPSSQAQEPLPPGSAFPSVDASLQRVNGSSTTVDELMGSSATVIVFWSNDCPWVDKYDSRVQNLVSEFQDAGVSFVLVNSNDASGASRESLQASQKRAEKEGYQAAYVRDAGASLARALGATRTPHVFVFDNTQTLVYEGAIDDSPGDPKRVEEAYLKTAIGALVEGEEVSVPETKAFGCTLKYPE